MSKKLNYTYVEEYKLLIESLRGEPSLEDVIQFKEEVSFNLMNEPKINLFVDIRDEESEICLPQLEQYIDYFLKSKHKTQLKKIAILTKTPEQVVKATLLNNSLREQAISCQIFSSLEAALRWLNTGITPEKLEEILDSFKLENEVKTRI